MSKDRVRTLIQEALSTGVPLRLPSRQFTGKERKRLTLEAERSGLVVYKSPDANVRRPELVLTTSRHEPCDIDALTPDQLKMFSDVCNVRFDDPCTYLEEMKDHGIPRCLLEAFVDEVQRFGLAGLKYHP